MATPAAPSADPSKIPQHVAVIMDGNGRWARRRGLPRVAGHKRGLDRARELVTAAGELGIRYVTLFAFSSENWQRPASEVQTLMELFMTALEREIPKLHENRVRFRVIGDVNRFGEALVSRIRAAERYTEANTGATLTVAANYGGRWDIAQACASVAQRAAAGELAATEVTPETIEQHLSTRGMPEPDLFIRTGGEQRISNFLLWQLAYTELYFTEVFWPDFDRTQFELALAAYAGRQRRFGKTGEQVEKAGNA
jgi:undecaprenyl diphosphate synthase